jgi:hypothetical protein
MSVMQLRGLSWLLLGLLCVTVPVRGDRQCPRGIRQ